MLGERDKSAFLAIFDKLKTLLDSTSLSAELLLNLRSLKLIYTTSSLLFTLASGGS